MGSKWTTVSINDIKLPEKYSCVGGPFGSSLSQKHYVDSGVPVIRGTNLAGDIFSESDFVLFLQIKQMNYNVIWPFVETLSLHNGERWDK